jgi:pimeloyl-ACP methyl ester carboxylesterase
MKNKELKNKLVAHGHKMDSTDASHPLVGEFSEFLQVEVHADTAVKLSPTRSGDAEKITLTTTGDDVVELILEDGLKLYTSMERLQGEIIPQDQQRGGDSHELTIPRQLVFTSVRSRGQDGLIVEAIRLLDVKGKLVDHITGKAAALTARKLAARMEDKLVGDGSVIRISSANHENKDDSAFPEVTLEDIDTSRPVLLFLHGTASSTAGSFSELWTRTNDNTWKNIKEHYGDNILALQHRTLTESPIDNAVRLLEILPENATLHLVSHSRGGLVGELLCRGQLSDSHEPFSAEDIELFDADVFSDLPAIFKEASKDYQHHKAQLGRLNTLLIEKQPDVQRFVRVACPARGTTLASGKLDIYLSGILNVIGLIPFLKASPVYGFLKTFTLAVARERTRPEQLPGLEAMMPGSPLIALLNTAPVSSRAPLAVIEGDIVPTGILKKIALFFLDQFYESDHDLVVNTPSMDGGARRFATVPVLFDQGKDVNHFQYFSNKRTRQGMLAALTESTSPPSGFQLRTQKPRAIARSVPRGRVSGEVPTVFILPGLSGSHLAVEGNKIWVDPFDLVRGKFTRLEIGAANVTALEVVAGTYGNLADYLADTHEVIPFPYDWRRSVLEHGRTLAALVDERLRNTNQPIRIIAHSMGGVVFRGMAAENPEVWERMKAREGSRVLMLGTPNRGSWSIPRIFARQDRLIKMLAAADLRHNHNELLNVLREFQGMLELLPLDDDDRVPGDAMWADFKASLGTKWNRPTKVLVKKAQQTWEKVKDKGLEPTHVFYIAGQADETPADVKIDNGTEKKIRFFSTAQGDGQVPWDTGIPEGSKHWYVDAVHGDIPDHEPAFEAMKEVLETGNTQRLATRPSISRGKAVLQEMLPDQIDIFPGEEAIYAASMGKAADESRAPRKRLRPLKVSVTHGDLCFTRYPVAVGHYQGDTIVSAEAALDTRLNKRLSKRQQLNLYPGPLQTNEILFGLEDDVFPGAVIIGLGEVGTLTPGSLTDTFREAVLRFVITGMECDSFKNNFIKLSSLLIGTGAGGIAPREAITSMLRAVTQANRLLAGPTYNIDQTVEAITFIELYEDVVVSAQHSLLSIADIPEFRGIVKVEPHVLTGDGGRRRVSFHEDPDWWQRLRIESLKDGSMKITALTSGGARVDIRTQPIQKQSVEPFLKAMTRDTSVDAKVGRTLFELLLPREFKVHAPDNEDLVLIVDEGSAIYPWELLEYAGHDGDEPMAGKSGLIRQLASHESDLANICNNRRALVIGDPLVDDRDFIELPSAQNEADTVHKLLMDSGYDLPQDSWKKQTGAEILTALMTDEYQILHLAGHGVVDYPLAAEKVKDKDCNYIEEQEPTLVTGMVIGKDHILTPVEIRQMPATPAFVFINCCHLGSTDVKGRKYQDQPNKLAANLATQLIRQGVRAVIAAGWAVDDNAAQIFAESFYQAFLSGSAFGEAVKIARAQTYDKHPAVNTWGAYQCYGDPGYTLKDLGGTGSTRRERTYVSLSEYVTTTNNIAEQAKTASPADIRYLRDKLNKMANTIPAKWKADARLQESLGLAWGEVDEFAKAIEACKAAMGASKSCVSIRCVEQLANFEARHAVELFEQAKQLPASDTDTKKQKTDNERAQALKEQATNLVDDALNRINGLNTLFGVSVERLALIGSVHKRQAMIYRNNKQQLKASLKRMLKAYKESHDKALISKECIDPYPMTNWLTTRWLLKEAGIDKSDKLDDFESLLDQAIKQTAVADPSINQEHFWDAIAETDCKLLYALKRVELDEKVDEIATKYLRIHRAASSPRQFNSVIEHLDFLKAMMSAYSLERDRRNIDKLVNKLRSCTE